MPGVIVLVLGGARSGKSAAAERVCLTRGAPVTYVATGVASDPEMAARIATHRARRPPEWPTVEPEWQSLVEAVRSATGTVLLDSLTAWVAAAPSFGVDGAALCAALEGRAGDAVVVSDEVGLGVHPATDAGRRFRDRLGELNQAVAEVADQVLLVVAGRVVSLERLEAGAV